MKKEYEQLWNDIEKQSTGFSENRLFNLSKLNNHEILEAAKDAISNLKHDDYSRGTRYVRIFKDYTISSEWAQALIESDLKKDESLADWMTRALGSDDYFIILSNAERLSTKLASMIADLVAPLTHHPSFSCMTCEAVLILGKYECTSLGIHYDNPIGNWHRVFQINLGPGKKEITFLGPG